MIYETKDGAVSGKITREDVFILLNAGSTRFPPLGLRHMVEQYLRNNERTLDRLVYSELKRLIVAKGQELLR